LRRRKTPFSVLQPGETLINKYGDGIQGLFGMTSVATPAGADAITQAGKCGKIGRNRPRDSEAR